MAAPACRARASACVTRARAMLRSRLLLAAWEMSEANSVLPNPWYHAALGQSPVSTGAAKLLGTSGRVGSVSRRAQPATMAARATLQQRWKPVFTWKRCHGGALG